MDENKVYNLIEKMYSELIVKVDGLGKEIQDVKLEIKDLKKQVINIEDKHGKKLDVLFDGYKQNSDKLDRIELEVSKHEEVILKRVK